ncbi:MAG: DsbA family protein [Pseudomonadota bacterium]
MLRIFALLTALTVATPTLAGPFDDLSAEDQAALNAQIRAYILDNPEIIAEALDVLEARQREAQQAADRLLVSTHLEALHDEETSFIGGNPEGDITIVEFLDYQCSFCKRAHPEVTELLSQDGNIRLIQREFPILGPMSEIASRAAISVLLDQGPELYATFSDAMLRHQGQLSQPVIDRLAEASGVDVSKMQALSRSNQVTQIIQANHQLARQLQITGTPTFVFGDQMVRGYLPLAQMQAVVTEQRSEM